MPGSASILHPMSLKALSSQSPPLFKKFFRACYLYQAPYMGFLLPHLRHPSTEKNPYRDMKLLIAGTGFLVPQQFELLVSKGPCAAFKACCVLRTKNTYCVQRSEYCAKKLEDTVFSRDLQ